MADPNTTTTSDQDIAAAIAKALGGGSTPATPADEWVDWIDTRTGEVIGIQNPKTGATKLYPKQTPAAAPPTPAQQSAQTRMDKAGSYDIPPGAGGIPKGYWDTAGVHHDFTAAQVAQYAPAAIQQRRAELQAEQNMLASDIGSAGSTDPGSGKRVAEIQTELASLDKNAATFAAGGSGGAGGSAPAISTTAKQVWGQKSDGTMGWVDNPNYTAPVAPKADAPAISTTAKQIWDGQKWVDNPNYTAPTAAAAQSQQDAIALSAVQSKQRMDEYAAQQEVLRKGLIEDIRLGLKTTPQAQAVLDQWTAANTSSFQLHAQQVLAAEEYNRNLPQAQATEARAQAADARAAQQQKVQQAQVRADAYNQQATEGQGMLTQGIKLGVAPSTEAVQQMYFDPHKRALDVLEQAMAGPEFDPHQRALDVIGAQMQPAQVPAPYVPLPMPTAPAITPTAAPTVTQVTPTVTQVAPTITPRAPMLGGPRAPQPW